VISEQPAHPALVSETEFLAVQQVTAIPAPSDQGARRCRLRRRHLPDVPADRQ
jgi:hypothetical protein